MGVDDDGQYIIQEWRVEGRNYIKFDPDWAHPSFPSLYTLHSSLLPLDYISNNTWTPVNDDTPENFDTCWQVHTEIQV